MSKHEIALLKKASGNPMMNFEIQDKILLGKKIVYRENIKIE
jgi:hypothetical protein